MKNTVQKFIIIIILISCIQSNVFDCIGLRLFVEIDFNILFEKVYLGLFCF